MNNYTKYPEVVIMYEPASIKERAELPLAFKLDYHFGILPMLNRLYFWGDTNFVVHGDDTRLGPAWYANVGWDLVRDNEQKTYKDAKISLACGNRYVHRIMGDSIEANYDGDMLAAQNALEQSILTKKVCVRP